MNYISHFVSDVCDSWEKLGTMGTNSRTGIISVKCKKGYQKDIANYRLLNLDYEIYSRIFKSRMQKTLDAIIGEN